MARPWPPHVYMLTIPAHMLKISGEVAALARQCSPNLPSENVESICTAPQLVLCVLGVGGVGEGGVQAFNHSIKKGIDLRKGGLFGSGF